jgi:pimeloyl-ACP methyl ester carboxylesterase
MTSIVTLIAIHGNGGGAFRFERTRPYFPSHVRFEPITLPGFGGRPRDPDCHHLADYAAHIRQAVNALPRPAVALGHGVGGSLLLEFLQHFSALIDGVILHAPVGARLDSRLFPKLMGTSFTRELGKLTFASPLARPFLKRMLFSESTPNEFLDQFFDEYGRCESFSHMFELITPQWFAGLKPVRLPSVLLWGAKERVLKLEQAKDFQAALPAATVEVVQNWDHFPMIDQPQEYAAKLTELTLKLAQ